MTRRRSTARRAPARGGQQGYERARSGAAFGVLGFGLLPLSFCEAARRQTAGVSSAPRGSTHGSGPRW